MAKIVISALDQEYSIRSGVDDQYLERLGQHVDAKIGEICSQVPEIEALKASVFAALNIADELFSKTKELDALKRGEKPAEKAEEKPALIIYDEEDVKRLERISSKSEELEQILEEEQSG